MKTKDRKTDITKSHRWIKSDPNPLHKKYLPPLVFVVLVLLLSWMRLLSVLLEEQGVALPGALINTALFIGALSPLIATIAVTSTTLNRAQAKCFWRDVFRWRSNPVWYLAAATVPVLFYGLVFLIFTAISDITFQLEVSTVMVLLAQIISIGLLFAFSENIGWRGYLQSVLQRPSNFLLASITVGLVWALWHLPLFYTPGTVQSSFAFMPYLLLVTGVSVFLGWLYARSEENVLVVAAGHLSFNAMVGLSVLALIDTGSDVSLYIAWLAGATWLAIVLVILGGSAVIKRISYN